MAKFLDVFSSVFMEEKGKEEKKTGSKTLKVFYSVDIHIKNPNKEMEQEPVKQEPIAEPASAQPAPVQAPVAPVQTPQIPTEGKKVKGKVLKEDEFNLNKPNDNGDYVYKNEGIINVPKEEYDNIQTFEDLLDFVSDSKDEKGSKILDEAAVELILSMVGETQTPLEDLVKKDDKVFIDINYGNKKTDSIGFKVLKRQGVNNLSIVMKKNNEILDGKFDLAQLNSQILFFRNGMINV